MRLSHGFAGFMALVYAGALCAADAAGQAGPRARQAARDDRMRRMPWRRRTRHCSHANPNLAGQHADYIAAQLAAFKAGTRPSPIMQGMAAGLSPEDMKSVGAVLLVPEARGIDGARQGARRSAASSSGAPGIKGTDVPACAGCHGAAGHGIPAQYPRLAGQNADLVEGWLKAYATGARPHQVMSPIAAKLSENDTKALAQYISGLR